MTLRPVFSARMSNGIRKYAHLSQSKRRFLHFLCAFLVGLLVARICSRRSHSQPICYEDDVVIVEADAADDGAPYALNGGGGGGGGGDYVEEAADGDASASQKVRDSGGGGGTGGHKKLLFVGVMTAQKYLDTRAAAVYETWGREIAGDVAFFTSATSVAPAAASNLPLVRLQGVDDSYPPQKKSFLMLQHMWRHLADRYEWFVRADDDVYIRPDKMERFLRSINSSRAQFIGQAGRGNQEEFGLLSLEYDENFCMGGPGIIFSRETLRRIAPHIKTCLRNLYTTHEDVELGRCVQKFARISCTWSYEMQSIFYHNFSGGRGFTGSLKTKEVHGAITLHPIKEHRHMYRIHNYMRGLKIRELQQRKISLYRDLYSLRSVSHFRLEEGAIAKILQQQRRPPPPNIISNLTREADIFGRQPTSNKYQPRCEDDVLTWDFISRSLFSHSNLNPRRKVETHLKEGLDDVIRELMRSSNSYSRERGRVIEFQQILYGYYQLNPLYGASYILDVLLMFKKYRGKKMTVPVRKHAYAQQQFTSLEIRETSNAGGYTERATPFVENAFEGRNDERSGGKGGETVINMVVPLSGKLAAFARFMDTFETVCLKAGERNVVLWVVVFASAGSDSFGRTLSVVERMLAAYPKDAASAAGNVHLIRVDEPFSRARALNYGMQKVASHQLLFFVDVDMIWDAKTLQRVRSNTGLRRSAYFPIVFSEFDPSVASRTSSGRSPLDDSVQRVGYWRIFGYGIASAYKADILEVGGFDTSIVGWGKEDVDLYEKFVAHGQNFTVFRSADPNLVHVFHVVDCDNKLDPARLTMCRNTRSETYGSVDHLANIIRRHWNPIFQYLLDRS